MSQNSTIGTTPGGPVSAGPEQHLHVDHGSAAHRASSNVASGKESETTGGSLKDRAGEIYQDSRGRVADGVDSARAWAGDRYDTACEQVASTVARTRDYVSDATDIGTSHLARQRSRAEAFVSDNPALVGVVGLAAGLILGALLPRTRQEDRAVGSYADEARDHGLRFAREAIHSGRAYVETALDQANDALARTEDEVRGKVAPQTQDTPSGKRKGPSGRYQNH